jgi:hypothetical protein
MFVVNRRFFFRAAACEPTPPPPGGARSLPLLPARAPFSLSRHHSSRIRRVSTNTHQSRTSHPAAPSSARDHQPLTTHLKTHPSARGKVSSSPTTSFFHPPAPLPPPPPFTPRSDCSHGLQRPLPGLHGGLLGEFARRAWRAVERADIGRWSHRLSRALSLHHSRSPSSLRLPPLCPPPPSAAAPTGVQAPGGAPRGLPHGHRALARELVGELLMRVPGQRVPRIGAPLALSLCSNLFPFSRARPLPLARALTIDLDVAGSRAPNLAASTVAAGAHGGSLARARGGKRKRNDR